jgi:hypothetical protein
LQEFYFQGRSTNDDALLSFVDEKWKGIAGTVAHVLTTNTHLWAAELGLYDFRRSGARHEG